ncbi:MAG: glycosyltransferase family 87 protein [Bacteroidetes bacterium]|nr:glycosyltransferase family 87 protein [Bacteroidota bacterium]
MNYINGHLFFSDFKVYYLAAKNLTTGGQVYMVPFGQGSGFYKYSPLTLFFFLPFTIFSFPIAALIHYCFLCFGLFYSFVIIRQLLVSYFFPRKIKHEWLLLMFSLICILIHVVRELYLGNINSLMLILSLVALCRSLQNKEISGGVLLAVIVLTKPFFLILLLPLLFRKRFKIVGWFIVTVLTGIILPFIVFGPYAGFNLHNEWINTMIIHDQGFPGTHTATYLLQHYLFHDMNRFMNHIINLAICILVCWLIYRNRHMESKGKESIKLEDKNFIFEWFVLLAMIPLLVKTDSEHFLASAPVIAFLIYFVAINKRNWQILVVVLLVLFFGANSTDLIGKDLSEKLDVMGVLGLSNLLLILLTCYNFVCFQKKINREG